MSLGNISTSSLIRTSESNRIKQQTLDDRLAQYEWDLSNKTIDDFEQYKEYLDGRIESESDPSGALTLQKKIVSARRSFTSHEIQRQTIKILEGTGNLATKYQTVGQLYQAAVANDDLDLAQSLRGQLDRLDISLQNEYARGAALADKMSKKQVTTVREYADALVGGKDLPDGIMSLEEATNFYKQYGEDAITALSDSVGGASYWDYATTIVENILEAYQTTSQLITDPEQANKLLKDYNDVVNGETTFDIAPGAGRLSYQDILDARDAAAAGQNLFEPILEDGVNKFKKTTVTSYVWGRDVNGNYRIIRTRDINPLSLDDKLEVNGDEVSYKEALENAGFEVIEGGETPLIRLTSASPLIDIPGMTEGATFGVAIGAGGKLRFISDASDEAGQRIFEINLGGGGGIEEVEQTVSIFGDQYGSPATDQGVDITKQLIGQTKPTSVLDSANFTGGTLQVLDTFQQPTDVIGTAIQAHESQQAELGQVLGTTNASIYGSTQLSNQIANSADKLLKTYNPQASPVGHNVNQLSVPSNSGLFVKPIKVPQITSVGPVKPKVTIGGVDDSGAKKKISGVDDSEKNFNLVVR